MSGDDRQSTLILPRGHVLIFDPSDRDFIMRHKWHAIPARQTYYAQCTSDGLNVLLHRELMRPGPGQIVDHDNRNGLDNRRQNLRVCTQSQNKANVPRFKNNTSGYKGVSYYKARGKWTARITVDYKAVHLGYFTDPWDAAQAYNAAALKYWGDFALLNEKKV